MKKLHKIFFLILAASIYSSAFVFAGEDKLFPSRQVTPQAKEFVGKEMSRLLKKYDVSNFENISDSDKRDIGDGILDLSIMAWVDPDPGIFKLLSTWCDKAIKIAEWGNNTDLDMTHLLFGLSIAYDWHKNKMTPELTTKIKEFLYSHGKAVYEFAQFAPGWWVNSYWQNHCWINYAGILATGLALEGDYSEAVQWQKLAKEKLIKSLELQPSFGSNHEGFNYSIYGNVGLIRGLALVEQTQPDIFQRSDYLKNYYQFYKAYAVSEKMDTFFDTGDSKRILGHSAVEIFSKLYQEYGNEEYAKLASYYLSKYQGKYQSRFPGLMTAVYGIPPESSGPISFSKADFFKDLGVYIEKTFDKSEVDTSFLFKSGIPGGRWAHELQKKNKSFRLNRSHSHPDQNHFIIWRKEGFLIADSGMTNKKKSTLEHNTLLINGQGQLGEGAKWFNEKAINNKNFNSQAGLTQKQIFNSDEISVVSADAAEFYPQDFGLNHFNRTIFWIKPIGFVIFDRVNMKKTAKGTLVFHSDFDFGLIKDQEYWINDGATHAGKWVGLYPGGLGLEIKKHTHTHKHEKFPKGQMMLVNKDLSPGNNYFVTLILTEDMNAASRFEENKETVDVFITSRDMQYVLSLNKENATIKMGQNKLSGGQPSKKGIELINE